MKHLKLIVLLIITLTIKSTAFTQTSSDSLKCFTYDQAKDIANKLKKASLCDSISQLQYLQILNYKNVVVRDKEIISLNEIMINDQKKNINTLNLKLKASKKLTFIGLPTAIIGGFITGYILSK